MNSRESELLRTDRFQVVSLETTFPDGRNHKKSVVRHPGAVVILPILEDGKICLIENYRVAVDRTLVELPAGTREPNETPLETAQRELIEETGYHAENWQPLTRFFVSPGIMDERMEVFVAERLTGGEAHRQPDEQIQNRLATLDEALGWIRDGQIEDAKTIAALLHYHHFHRIIDHAN